MTDFRASLPTSTRGKVLAVVAAAALPAGVLAGMSPAAADDGCQQSGSTVTCTYTADASFVVPAGVATLHIFAVGGDGAAGGDQAAGAGGDGDALTTEVPVGASPVVAGQELAITIGGNAVGATGGANGGGAGATGTDSSQFYAGGGGGGATAVTGSASQEPVAVAAGGGGGGGGWPGIPEMGFAHVFGGAGGSAHVSGDGRNGGDGEGSLLIQFFPGGGGGTGQDGGEPTTVEGISYAQAGADGSDSGTGGSGGHGGPGLDGPPSLAPGGGGGAGLVGGGGGGGSALGAAAGGGAAGTSYSIGTIVSHEASDGTPRVVITYDVPPPTTAGDIVVPVNDGAVSASCGFSVRSVRGSSVTAKFTTKAKELKPSFFAKRTVANLTVGCTADPTGAAAPFGTSFSANSNVMYRTRYLKGPAAPSYTVCVDVTYTLRSGVVRHVENCSS